MSAAMGVLLVMGLLLLKHFICDFPLQMHPYQYENKGTYGHPGGLLHSGIHIVGTLLVMGLFVPIPLALGLALLDGLIHYHVDWVKMNINRIYNWKPDNSEFFWLSLGVDQMLHGATYILLVFIIL